MHIRLIDANGLGFAIYHLCKRDNPEDPKPRVLQAFLEHIRTRLKQDSQVVNVIVWDGRAQWRYDLLPTYKGTRGDTEEKREDRRRYEEQRPLIQQALTHFPVIQVRHPGAEADDVCFGLSQQLAHQGCLVELQTSDTDWWTMLHSPRIRWVSPKKATGKTIDLANFQKETGFASPSVYAQAKALAGDTADDIDGVPQVALKRGAELINRFGSLEGVLYAAGDVLQWSKEPKYYQALSDPRVQDLVLRNKKLIDLSQGPALRAEDVVVTVGQPYDIELLDLLVAQELHDIVDMWAFWHQLLSKELPKGDVQMFQRALAKLPEAWAQPEVPF